MRFALPSLRRDLVWQALILFTAVFVGLLAGVDPQLAAFAALAVAFLVLTVVNLAAAVALFCCEPLNLSPTSSTVVQVMAIVLVAAWLAFILSESNTAQRRLAEHRRLLLFSAALFSWICLSLSWADDTAAGLTSIRNYTLAFLLVPIVITTISTPRNARLIPFAFIGGAVFAGLFSLASGSPGEVEGRLSSSFLDPNQLGATLVAATALAGGMALAGRSPAVRTLAAGAAGICFLLSFMTGSRGAFLAMLTLAVAALAFSGPWRLKVGIGVCIALLGGAVYLMAFSPAPLRERLFSIDPDNAAHSEARGTVWKVGMRMARENPVLGVGTGNFANSSIDYVIRPGLLTRTDQVISTPKVAHNNFLGWFAELGLPGLFMALGVIFSSLASYWAAAAAFGAQKARQMEAMARSGMVALIGYLAACMFVSLEHNKLLWLLIAFGPALLSIAKAGGSEAEPLPAPEGSAPPTRGDGPQPLEQRAVGASEPTT